MRQRIHRPPTYPEYSTTGGFRNAIDYSKISDKFLMKRFLHDHLYSHMSTEFIQLCAELGKRGYKPEPAEIRRRLR